MDNFSKHVYITIVYNPKKMRYEPSITILQTKMYVKENVKAHDTTYPNVINIDLPVSKVKTLSNKFMKQYLKENKELSSMLEVDPSLLKLDDVKVFKTKLNDVVFDYLDNFVLNNPELFI